MKRKNKIHLQQALLDPLEINDCIQQGHYWNGNGMPWSMREPRQGNNGDITSQQQGSGIDFSETRAYQAGDEPRHINWRATARSGRPQVRVFHEELSPHCYFLIDRRASMRFGTRTRLKVSQAARLAIFLASREAQKGAQTGYLILNEKPQWQPATRGQQGIYQLAQLATAPCPPMRDDSTLSIKQALSLLAEHIPPGSHIYLLSDFYDLQKDMLAPLYQLGQQHHAWAIGIYDKAERQLPIAGYLQLLWKQHTTLQNNILVNTQDKTLVKQCRQRFEQKQQHIKKLCEMADINFTSVCSSTENISSALLGNAL